LAFILNDAITGTGDLQKWVILCSFQQLQSCLFQCLEKYSYDAIFTLDQKFIIRFNYRVTTKTCSVDWPKRGHLYNDARLRFDIADRLMCSYRIRKIDYRYINRLPN